MKTKIASLALLLTLIFPIMAKSQVKIQQTAGRDALGEFAPEFARLNDDILFGEVWSRNNLLSLRDRSIVTVVALMSQGLTDSSFKYHLESAKKNGVTRTEIAEILTHAAFYAGWPKAWAAFRMAKEVWTDGNADSVAAGSLEAYAQTIIFPVGKPNDAYAKYFIGQSYTAPVVTDGVPVVNVTFEPGCRNNWHVHKAVELHSGDAINIPAGVKHWHGAAPDSWFSHLAIEVPGENNSTEWLEPVGDEEYSKLK
ncbi:carboxymuconolactone decarboxylase family protein [Phocaeicola dorei]|uniref:carboxymuconolactone decarboxylase family protein n=1 Tax=Phocaeicola dorei TaxID=357276 RepID=UPI00221F3BD1|nr:carboxymuconolactone decarboxylase family protein [Phocaeicola dorei]UYV10406.1 carboxymuconolactone decarboxylase family protein [Phocaeicola dorei]